MSIIINAKNLAILDALQEAIDNEKIKTWSCEGFSFSYHADQYEGKAHFKADFVDGSLVFNLLPPKGRVFDKDIYGIYHGQLAQMLLNHVADYFTSIEIFPE